MVSIIIPTINDPYVSKTIENVRENAKEKIEFIIINDGGEPFELKGDDVRIITNPIQRGRRVSINDAARIARGNYLFILDAHCSMSQDWDVKMMESVKDNNLVYCVIRDMTPDFKYIPGDYLHVYMNREYTEKWWPKKPLEKCEVEEESMCITGCAWMVTKQQYWRLGGYDENLGHYGWDGPEWSCKIWLNEKWPGKVILRTDVICGHIFGTNNSGKMYSCKMIPKKKYIEYMTKKWGSKINTLVERFEFVPDWKGKELPMHNRDDTGREVKLERQKIIETKKEGEVIKRVIEYYEYIYRDDGTGPSEEEIKNQHINDLKKVREEVWELKDGQLQKVA